MHCRFRDARLPRFCAAQEALRRDIEGLPEAELQSGSTHAGGGRQLIHADGVIELLRMAERAPARQLSCLWRRVHNVPLGTRQELGDGSQQLRLNRSQQKVIGAVQAVVA